MCILESPRKIRITTNPYRFRGRNKHCRQLSANTPQNIRTHQRLSHINLTYNVGENVLSPRGNNGMKNGVYSLEMLKIYVIFRGKCSRCQHVPPTTRPVSNWSPKSGFTCNACAGRFCPSEKAISIDVDAWKRTL